MRSVHRILPFVSSLVLAACGGATPPPSAPAAPAPEAPAGPEAAHHGGHEHGAHAEHGAEPAAGGELKKPGEANVGDKSTCAVSGEEFVVEASSPKVEHAGKTYYFCCKGCAKKFQEDPQKFLGQQQKPAI